MGMPAQQTVWTAEMVRALPGDGNRYEVLDGVLFVSPAPSALHQRAVARLWAILDDYCRKYRIGEAMISPADIEFSEHRVLQPDVFVIPLIDGRRIRSWNEVTSLLLSAEVISPSTARADRGEKRRILQDEHVPDYWIVDLDARIFERWRPVDERPEVLSDRLQWHPEPAVTPLVIDLREYFDSVLGE
jgi:Uma2 family endonuclease